MESGTLHLWAGCQHKRASPCFCSHCRHAKMRLLVQVLGLNARVLLQPKLHETGALDLLFTLLSRTLIVIGKTHFYTQYSYNGEVFFTRMKQD